MGTHLIANAAMSAFIAQLVEQLKPEIAAVVQQQIAEANRCGVAAAVALDYMQFSDTIAAAIENDTAARSAATALVGELVSGFMSGELSDHAEFRELEGRVTDVEDFEPRINHHDSRLDELEAEGELLKTRHGGGVSQAELVSALRTLLLDRIA